MKVTEHKMVICESAEDLARLFASIEDDAAEPNAFENMYNEQELDRLYARERAGEDVFHLIAAAEKKVNRHRY